MAIKLSEIRVGECFRYVDPAFGDGSAWFADSVENPRPKDLPKGWDATDVDDKKDAPSWWRDHGDRLVEVLEHYRRAPEPTVLTRGHIQVGECYLYDMSNEAGRREAGGDKVIMLHATGAWPAIPAGWRVGLVSEKRANHLPVRRIPHWEQESEEVAIDALAKPDVGTPLERLLAEKADGATGEECLEALEAAMQTESLCRTAKGFVSTLSDYPLNEAQAALGLRVWEAKLAAARAATMAREAPATLLVDLHQDDALGDW